jgi:hypothetical protein
VQIHDRIERHSQLLYLLSLLSSAQLPLPLGHGRTRRRS